MRNAKRRHSAVRTHISNYTSHELCENGTFFNPNWLTAAVWTRSAPDLLNTSTTEHSALPLGLAEQCSFAELTTGTGTEHLSVGEPVNATPWAPIVGYLHNVIVNVA